MDLSGMTYINMELNRFDKEEEFVDAAVKLIKKIVAETDDVCRIALSGGSTPKPVYKALSKSDIDFSKVEFYQVDERYVPKDNDNSNYKLINQSLVKPLGDKLRAFHFFDTSLPIEECIKKYSEKIELINFDLVLLGMGSDGHIASLFPGDKTSIDSTNPAIHTTTEEFAVKDRLTISLKKIQESPNKILLLNDPTKEAVLNALVYSDKNKYELPAKGILVDSNLEHDTMTYILFIA
jgi:6-phosphogluconolactonase